MRQGVRIQALRDSWWTIDPSNSPPNEASLALTAVGALLMVPPPPQRKKPGRGPPPVPHRAGPGAPSCGGGADEASRLAAGVRVAGDARLRSPEPANPAAGRGGGQGLRGQNPG